MSVLYNDLSRVYDIIFPENPFATAFLLKDLRPNSRILDIACGTGTYTMALARIGHTVWGLDLDGEMIAAAQRKAAGYDVSFITGNMLDIDVVFSNQVFDLIFCIGNSLVHLGDRESVAKLVEKAFGLLGRNGIFIVQIVNYDRIIRDRIESLPIIERAEHGVTFIRNYKFTGDPEHVNFNTEILCGDSSITNSVRLLALRSGDLADSIRSAGFSDVCLYGGYDESRHDENSMATVVRGRRR